MRILIVENVTPIERDGGPTLWQSEAVNAFGLAAEDDFDVCIGLDENGDTHIIWDKNSEVVKAESVMT